MVLAGWLIAFLRPDGRVCSDIAPYTATKDAVANTTKGMATDWARHGLQCNAIAPGYFDTPLNAALVADPNFTGWLMKRTPRGDGQYRGTCRYLHLPCV